MCVAANRRFVKPAIRIAVVERMIDEETSCGDDADYYVIVEYAEHGVQTTKTGENLHLKTTRFHAHKSSS